MIHWTAQRAVLAGIGVLILAQLLYIGVLLKINHHELLRWILLGAPGLAAFIAAYSAPNRKLLIGLSMALYGALIGMLSAIGYEYFGLHVDRIGGLFATFMILLAYYAALSIVGSVAGLFLSRKTKSGR
jgi:hypothetical protein